MKCKPIALILALAMALGGCAAEQPQPARAMASIYLHGSAYGRVEREYYIDFEARQAWYYDADEHGLGPDGTEQFPPPQRDTAAEDGGYTLARAFSAEEAEAFHLASGPLALETWAEHYPAPEGMTAEGHWVICIEYADGGSAHFSGSNGGNGPEGLRGLKAAVAALLGLEQIFL